MAPVELTDAATATACMVTLREALRRLARTAREIEAEVEAEAAIEGTSAGDHEPHHSSYEFQAGMQAVANQMAEMIKKSVGSSSYPAGVGLSLADFESPEPLRLVGAWVDFRAAWFEDENGIPLPGKEVLPGVIYATGTRECTDDQSAHNDSPDEDEEANRDWVVYVPCETSVDNPQGIWYFTEDDILECLKRAILERPSQWERLWQRTPQNDEGTRVGSSGDCRIGRLDEKPPHIAHYESKEQIVSEGPQKEPEEYTSRESGEVSQPQPKLQPQAPNPRGRSPSLEDIAEGDERLVFVGLEYHEPCPSSAAAAVVKFCYETLHIPHPPARLTVVSLSTTDPHRHPVRPIIIVDIPMAFCRNVMCAKRLIPKVPHCPVSIRKAMSRDDRLAEHAARLKRKAAQQLPPPPPPAQIYQSKAYSGPGTDADRLRRLEEQLAELQALAALLDKRKKRWR